MNEINIYIILNEEKTNTYRGYPRKKGRYSGIRISSWDTLYSKQK